MTDRPAMRLDQFLKLQGLVGSGGQAKLLIQGGEVLVNGERETRRRRKMVDGDVVRFDGHDHTFKESQSEEGECPDD